MFSIWKVILTIGLLATAVKGASTNSTTDGRRFPKGFKFGIATASYQVEGAWNQTGKGWSIWDVGVHMDPTLIKERYNGDIACDSFHKYKEDVQNIKKLGADFYRFSISWPRIMPKGLPDKINQAGVDYYHNLINELLANGIEPLVTMYHGDLPEHIQNLGGFMYNGFDKIFGDYADFLFKTYGYKVKWWTTFNEPISIIQGFSTGALAPFFKLAGTGDYNAGHNLLKAHAKAYHIYKDNYAYQRANISLNINGNNCLPKTNSAADKEAVERCWAFGIGYFIHPIFSKSGDYSDLMKAQVKKLSEEQGVPNRLPTFTKDEIEYIRGTYDFLAINSYTATLVTNGRDPNAVTPSIEEDGEFTTSQDPKWPVTASNWLFVAPEGLRPAMNWLNNTYGNLPTLITEFGYSDNNGALEDDNRINYFTLYFEEIKKSILDDGCNIFGAVAWSLMDNLEWAAGYTQKFGLLHVDFNDPERTRTWKKSAHWYKNFIRANKE